MHRTDHSTNSFLELLQTHKGIIYKVANAYCRDEENKKDLVQEIIIQAWLSFHKYNERYKLSTWMYRIALNVSISFYRKERRRSQINLPLPATLLYFQEDTPDETDADLEQLQRFIKELREVDRAILILYLEKNAYQEIADILGISLSSVGVRISRIKQQLRNKFSTIKNQ